jgi:hypothetical protein
VEPAVYMDRNGTMLWNQKKYAANPLRNPEGIFRRFDRLPLMEWGLLLTYKLFPDAGMEFKTRLFAHTIGVLVLLSAYIFFCGYFPKKFTLLYLGLLAMNPVFSFTSYVTVLDGITILFMFLSLRQITVYFERKRIISLWWAGIWFGVGNAVKYPLFLWLAPISFLLMYYESKTPSSFIKDYFIYMFVSLFTTFFTMVSVKMLISSPGIAIALGFTSVGILFVLRYYLEKKKESIQRLSENIWSNKKIFISLLALFLGFGIFLFRYFQLHNFAEEFLTDRNLIGNFRLYKYMLLYQFKNYMTRDLFWIGFFGIPFALLMRERPMRKVWIPFAFGSVLYWIVASKSIFFHLYYTMIIMITLTISAAYFIHSSARIVKDPLKKSLVFLFFAVLVLPPAVDATNNRMKNYVNVDNVVKFIKENTKPDEFILFEGFLTPLSIYTGRGFVMPAVLIDNTIREEIRRIGFAGTMRKYKIKYLFTPNDRPYYSDYAPLFEQTNITEASGRNFNRGLTIFRTIGRPHPDLSNDLRQLEEIEKKHRIREKFVLAAQLGRFKFFSFQD